MYAVIPRVQNQKSRRCLTTVQELIDHLRFFNPSAEVLIADDNGNEFSVSEASCCKDGSKAFICFDSDYLKLRKESA